MPHHWLPLTAPLILIVDDDPTICALAHAYLQLEGYRVRTAGNGEEALAALRECVPSVIIVDLKMPVMDGVELRRRQLAMPNVADVPFILMSADAHVEQAAERLRASYVLVKPFDNEELKSALTQVCA